MFIFLGTEEIFILVDVSYLFITFIIWRIFAPYFTTNFCLIYYKHFINKLTTVLLFVFIDFFLNVYKIQRISYLSLYHEKHQ